MVADVTTRESHSDGIKSARKGARPSRKPAKPSARDVTDSRPAGKSATARKRPSPKAARTAQKNTRTSAPQRTAKPKAGSAAPASARKTVTKAGFVRTQPLTLPAKDVVTAAAKLGLRMTPDYVHKVRSSTKARDRLAGVSSTAAMGRAPAPELLAPTAAAAATSNGEATFRKLVLDLGLQRAKRLLADIERRLAPLLR